MAVRTYLTTADDEVAEGTSCVLSFVVQDEDGVALADTDLTTLTVTLYNKATGAIINSRTDVDILNDNNGTVDGSGNGTWKALPADNPILATGRSREEHVAYFEWTWNAGADAGGHEVIFTVVNLLKET